MKSAFLVCNLLIFLVTISQAQKKIIPASKSAVTGIDLPAGSKQDGRVLSQSMAGVLMETESDKRKTKLRTAEVLVLPSVSKFNKDSLAQRLSSKNWKIIATDGDNYLWLQKDKSFVIAFFSVDTKGVNLYFAEAVSTPDFNTLAENTTSNQPTIQPIQGTNKAIELPDGIQQSNKITNATNVTSGSLTNYVWKSHQNRKDAVGNHAGYSTNSYQFYSNGTYQFANTTFQYYTPKYYLVFEEGVYQIDGSKITLKPVKSRFEVHQQEKTDPVIKSGNLGLEVVQYDFEYATIYDRLRLILAPTTSSETKRDGGFNFYANGAMTKSYIYDAEAIELKKSEIIDQPTVTNNTTINSPITGTWRRGKGVTLYGGRWSSTGYQYSFNTNGTYTYIIKTYVEDDPETLLTRENGIYTISGNTVTLDPKTNVIEAWSKSNGGDNYKALITTQNKQLEKITYQFTIQFIPELKETGLVLQYRNETARDGKYNGTDSFPNGWRFSPAGPDYKPIKLPGE
jgi:hypothetical protein